MPRSADRETAWLITGLYLATTVGQPVTPPTPRHSRHRGGTVKLGLGAVTEIVYNHYHNRLGMPMPTTLRYTESKRPAGANYFFAWETLTHANNPR